MRSRLRSFFSRPAPQALRVSSRAFTYRFYLSTVLLLLVLFSLALHHSALGIFILALIDLCFCGDVLLVCAIKDLWNARMSFVVLVILCIGSGFIYSTYNTFATTPWQAPTTELYGYVLFVLTLSLWAQRRLVHQSERAQIFMKKVDDFLPKSARVLMGRETKKIFADQVRAGDRILVKPGEHIPADGTIVKGQSAIEEELISGNILPAVKKEGSRVFAGTLNKTTSLEIEVTHGLKTSVIMGVVDAIKTGETRRSQIKSPLDTNAWWLFWVIVAIALGVTWYGGHLLADSVWKQKGLFLWAVGLSCPASLLFCTVLPAFFLKVGGKFKKVWVQNLTALDDITAADVFFFDKTGTLTQGELTVSGVYAADKEKERTLLEILAAVEVKTSGPFAQAVLDYVKNQSLKKIFLSAYEVRPGQGIVARAKGEEILAGSLHWLEERGVEMLPAVQEHPSQSIIGVAISRQFLGYVTLADQIRPHVKETLEFLKQKGKQVVLVSGDNEGSVSAVAKYAGIDKFNFEVLPKTKAEIVSNLQMLGKKVAMVGDGFNDVIALLKADGGVVFSTGRNVYNNWVDILIKRKDLYPLVYLFKIKKGLRAITLENFILALLLHAMLVACLAARLPQASNGAWPLGGSLIVLAVLFLNSMRMLRIK